MNIGRNIVNLARYKIRASRRFTPRFINYYSIKCSITGNNENLQITKEKDTQYFPLVWLRDNCRCENCYHDESSSRILNWKSFNVDVRTVSVEVSEKDTWHSFWFPINHSQKMIACWSRGKMGINLFTITTGSAVAVLPKRITKTTWKLFTNHQRSCGVKASISIF